MKIYILQIAFFVLFIVSMFLLFKINFFKAPKPATMSFTKATAKAKRMQIDAGSTLKKYEIFILKVESLLKRLGKSKSYLVKLLIICFFVGSAVGYICFRGGLLAVATGFCFTPLTYLYLMFRTQELTRQEIAELENTMSIITNSYLSNNNIVKSVELYLEEKNRYVEASLKKITAFDEFVSDALLINPNIERGLDRLATKINNHYFDQWVKNLRLCLQNKDMKFSLRPVIDAMADEKIMQVESDSQMIATWRNYILTVGVMFAIIPALRIAQEAWYLTLTQTTIGKGFILLMMIIALLTAIYVMKINKPISTI